jgi:hypothetical protein
MFEKKGINKRKGQIVVLVSVGLVVLLGLSSLVSDFAIAAITRNRLQYAIDAAVLAGAQEVKISEAKALQTAEFYYLQNGGKMGEVTFQVNKAAGLVSAQSARELNTFFAKLLGINTMNVDASGTAMVGVIGSVSGGLRPYAVEDRYYDYGELIVLKQDSSYRGNYGSVALGGTGASILKENAINGYNGTIKIGDFIKTETGNMSGVVSSIKTRLSQDSYIFTDYAPDSYRLWTIPVVDTLKVSGRDSVQVRGFAQVFVEDVRNSGGKMEIVGRFIEFVAIGEINQNAQDFGVYAVKLVH